MRENKIYAFFFFSPQATKQINRIITQDRFPTNVLLYLPLKASEHIQYQRVHSYESNTAFIKKKTILRPTAFIEELMTVNEPSQYYN